MDENKMRNMKPYALDEQTAGETVSFANFCSLSLLSFLWSVSQTTAQLRQQVRLLFTFFMEYS
jgi:hypothetical protein